MTKLGNPGPLGLLAFATTTLVLSFHNAGIGLKQGSPNNIVAGLAMFYGGGAQLLAGMWAFAVGNTFVASAFTSYGAFWMSFAAVLIPGFGFAAGQAKNSGATTPNSLGIFLLGWTLVTFIFVIGAYRVNLVTATLFTFLFVTFILLTIGEWRASNPFMRAGGSFGVVTAFIAYYDAATQLISFDTAFVKKTMAPFNPPKQEFQPATEA